MLLYQGCNLLQGWRVARPLTHLLGRLGCWGAAAARCARRCQHQGPVLHQDCAFQNAVVWLQGPQAIHVLVSLLCQLQLQLELGLCCPAE